MVTKVQKWGNSQGLRLSRQIMDEAGLAVGSAVDVSVKEGMIIIAPSRRPRARQNLPDLVSRIPKGCTAVEEDWGKPVGKEIR